MSIGSRGAVAALGAACLLGNLVCWPAVADAMQAGSQVPFVTVARGAQSGVQERLEAVVRSPVEWATLWTRHAGRAAAPPPVDFATDMIIAVFGGTRPTSGYEVEITEVVTTEQGLQVTYRRQTPPAGAVVRPALTSPFHIIRLPRAEGPVRVGEAPS